MTRLAPLVLTAVLGAAAFQTTPPTPPVPPQIPARDPGAAPQSGTSTIVGTVMTTDAQPQPIRRATVSVSGGGLRAPRQVVTDASGRFVVPDLPSGSFTLSASKPSFVSMPYGAKQPGQPSTTITLTPGQRFVAEMRIARGSEISGTVFDP